MTRATVTVNARDLAVEHRSGRAPTLVWLGGFRSDMTATKASVIDAWAESAGQACLRFDYSGHGASSGQFSDGTLTIWLEDALGVIEAKAPEGPLVLVGSSMGGFIALLIAERLKARIAHLVLIAPAVDFTERLMWHSFPDDVRQTILDTGVWMRPSAYAPEPTPITRALIEDGRTHSVLHRSLDITCPVDILHGTADPDVPWQLSVELMGILTCARVALTLVRDGDHRLSNPEDLALLTRTTAAAVDRIGRDR
jgi:pimeloyl-ACP methyl ester carboxylesterase